MREPIETAPVMELTAQDLDHLVEEVRDSHALDSPWFQRREPREWAGKVPAWLVAGESPYVHRTDGAGPGRCQRQGGADDAMVHP